jgi:phosphorylcholine metabolism protein LicD
MISEGTYVSTVYEQIKSIFRNNKVYGMLRRNPLLLKINNHYRNKAEESKKESVQKYGFEGLLLVKEAYKENNLEFWLDYGTLLGAIREKDFIGHDADMDLGTMFKSNDDVKNIEASLIKKGFSKYREFWLDGKIVEETYIYKGVNIDIFHYFQNEENRVHCFLLEEGNNTIYKKDTDYTFITGLIVTKISSAFTKIIWIDFKGEQFPIPESYDQYLKDNYGETYMIKDENWNWSRNDDDVLPFKDNTKAYLFHIS